jgi:hypothetical protein
MKIGDKVICVDVGVITRLELNKIYTIDNILGLHDGVISQILLKEIDFVYYKQSRFISLKENRKLKLQNVENIYN